MMGTAEVRTDRVADGVFRITLDRPAKRNAITPAMIAALDRVTDWALTDPAVRAIVVTGAGGVFSAGADLTVFAAGGPAAGAFVRHGNRIVDRLATASKPVVAGVTGPALGGGFEFALGCTFRVASDRAVFGLPEVTLGLLPAWGGVTNLTRLCGPGVALDIALSGRTVSPEEAHKLGIVHRVVPTDEVETATVELATRLAGWSPAAVAGIVELASPGRSTREREVELFDAALSRPEAQATVARFLTRRRAA